jgi:hypothetical protein
LSGVGISLNKVQNEPIIRGGTQFEHLWIIAMEQLP